VLVESGEQPVKDVLTADLALPCGIVALTLSGHVKLALAHFTLLSVQPISGIPLKTRGPELDIILAGAGAVPVNLPGLADGWATQKVDSGSAGAVADWRRARSRAGTALWPSGAPVRPSLGVRRLVSNLRLLV
jgi:hypothetical protein